MLRPQAHNGLEVIVPQPHQVLVRRTVGSTGPAPIRSAGTMELPGLTSTRNIRATGMPRQHISVR